MTDIIVRSAALEDAQALFNLNMAFNGEDISLEYIADSIRSNDRELVFLAECDGKTVGFCCVQLKKSFCYNVDTAEITEMYVDEKYRRRGIGKTLIEFAEKICKERYNPGKFMLLTGQTNLTAQALYRSCGYEIDSEVLFAKRV